MKGRQQADVSYKWWMREAVSFISVASGSLGSTDQYQDDFQHASDTSSFRELLYFIWLV